MNSIRLMEPEKFEIGCREEQEKSTANRRIVERRIKMADGLDQKTLEAPGGQCASMMQDIGRSARAAARVLATVAQEQKNAAIRAAADAVRASHDDILSSNRTDLENGRASGLSSAKLDRLALNADWLAGIEGALRAVAGQEDPVGRILAEWSRPSGLRIKRISTPLGVIGIIYESRPNVTADAGALCLKSGNAAILRGGSDSFHSSEALHKCLLEGLDQAKLPKASIQRVPTTDRAAVGEMLRMPEYIDVVVPRGGKSLVERIQAEARVPVFAHLEGICHVYVDANADAEKARRVVLNAKTRRTGICGAAECILVDRSFWEERRAPFLDDLVSAGVQVRAEGDLLELDGTVAASSDDFGKEFLDMVVAARIVNGLDGAIKHIAEFGSGHTDSIITECDETANRFFSELDSAILMRNASTQFADGGEFGMGAEIGISTGKIHARGPVGAEQLTSFKYLVEGDGAIRP